MLDKSYLHLASNESVLFIQRTYVLSHKFILFSAKRSYSPNVASNVLLVFSAILSFC